MLVNLIRIEGQDAVSQKLMENSTVRNVSVITGHRRQTSLFDSCRAQL
jgi:hypothetical protein